MTNKYSGNDFNQLIQLLADNIEIDELAERLGINIKKNGATSVALCIEHKDSNPSMYLYKRTAGDRSHYHCFSCTAHGDIFKLVKIVKNFDFTTAVKWLADTYGYSSSKTITNSKSKSTTKKPAPRKELIIDQPSNSNNSIDSSALENALEIYKEKSSSELKNWLSLRNIKDSTANNCEIILSRPKTLSGEMENLKGDYGLYRVTLEKFENAGLIRKEDLELERNRDHSLYYGNSYRDFFYDERVIFPIRDENQKLLGFAGRKIKETSKSPKYLYSPGLPKSQILYRAHEAFSKIKLAAKNNQQSTLYVCEGLLDCLRLEELGYAAVSILGANISEQQSKILVELANTLPEQHPLHLSIFLDRDQAGLKGAALSIEKLLNKDISLRLELSFIWPTNEDVSGNSNPPKDPDEFLNDYENYDAALPFLNQSRHPVALALISEKLKIPPTAIINNDTWGQIPDGAKFNVGQYLYDISRGVPQRLLTIHENPYREEQNWINELTHFSSPKDIAEKTKLNIPQDQKNAIKLNLARDLAQAGANKGEVLSDVAAWRRLSLAATAFNEGISSRLRQSQFQPIEPFDSAYVSRGFGKIEPRLKTMPCPEDLIAQQYIINELLSEQNDNGTNFQFSNSIPAVRYYRSSDSKRTTGETNGSSHKTTLSFAYQIDMDALEGRSIPLAGGIFRPYFECWKEFIASLLSQGEGMNQVHMIRLDLKRYYDNIKRSVMKNMLHDFITPAYSRLANSNHFAPLFMPNGFIDERDNAVVDFLIDQSFGFHYYHPDSGELNKSDRERGIPQGPILSAWLGNILLFQLDSKIREKLEEYNSEAKNRAGYARYVDDVVIISESLDILNVLRAIVEDVTSSLGLEMVPKENFAPMSAQAFLDELTSGRALAVSGPREEPEIFEIDDQIDGWDAWQDRQITRQNSLELLRDTRLYQGPHDTVINQLYTALRARDLRPAELSKAARWAWYISAITPDKHKKETILETYWDIWNRICHNLPFKLSSELPWDDPSFYALEGLQNLLERANKIDYGFNTIESRDRKHGIIELAKVASDPSFYNLFYSSDSDSCPEGWGSGARSLKRMFIQKIICIQWMASQLSRNSQRPQKINSLALEIIDTQNASFKISLNRSIITDTETNHRDITNLTVSGNPFGEWNILRWVFLWLHKAIVALAGTPEKGAPDPLASFAHELYSIIEKSQVTSNIFTLAGDNLVPILECLLPTSNYTKTSDHTPSGETTLLALQTFAAITPRTNLAHLLVNRKHLLQDGDAKIPLPPLPGIPANGLLLYSDTSNENGWINLTKVWWVTLPDTDKETEVNNPNFKISNANNAATKLAIEWKQAVKIGKLEIFEADFKIANNFWIPSYPPIFEINASKLNWIANVYEAIIRINQPAPANLFEFVPAWPYFATTNRPDQDDENSPTISLLTPNYHSTTLDGQAFVREGSRGLRNIEIPEQYGRYWRAGVFLSEFSGFRRDIDTFAELDPKNLDNTGRPDLLEPATHLLRNVLRKLRGTYFKDQVLSSIEDEDHLPATIARSLDLLRKFPKNGVLVEEILYVIASEAETAAMHIRLSGELYPFAQGLFCHYLEKISLKFVNFMPSTWAAELTENKQLTPTTNRAVPTSYFELSSRLSVTANATNENSIYFSGLYTLALGFKMAAISAWARELAFTIEALGVELWPYPLEGEFTQALGIPEKGFITDQPEDAIGSLNEYFASRIKSKASESAFSKITALGWLALIGGRIGLYGESRHIVWPIETKKVYGELINSLSINPSIEEKISLDQNWPFEFDCNNIFSAWNDVSVVNAINCLQHIETCLNITVHDVKGSWKLNLSESSIKSASGEEWSISKWQVLLSGGSKPERILEENKFLSVWQETYDVDSNLILVSARDEKLGKILTDPHHNIFIESELVDHQNLTFTQPHSSTVTSEESTPSTEIQTPITDNLQEEPTNDELEKQYFTKNTEIEFKKTFKDWRSIQEKAWAPRLNRSPGHVRIAIMQWAVDDTYRHPIQDFTDWDKKVPPKKTAPLVTSNIERRRRAFLLEALSACKSFGVDLLVLPEYSVRPDTIKWLKSQLSRKPGFPAVLAGTYKLFGNTTDPQFFDIHNDILGFSDHQKTFATPPPTTPNLYISGEHSSVLTLLAPLKLKDGERLVCTFSRRKKYSSLAASEVFSPLLEPLAPLLSSESILSEVSNRNTKGFRTNTKRLIQPEEILEYIKELKRLSYSTEFICSELFLPMSPVNYKALAAELRKLAAKFGSSISAQNAEDRLIVDLVTMSEYLGLSGEINGRRSIIIVPAMTSRSADYWIFGQSTLLSGGATTVFCNAVCKDTQSVGGSCFIGRESWSNSKKSIFHDLITPYSGWSKGIYYNNPNDALGKTEQALVIADIDPFFMQEGKPRPQALAVPLQLVAYLPFAELNNDIKTNFYTELNSSIALINSANISGAAVSPKTPGVYKIQELLEKVFEPDNFTPINDRYNHWKNNWRSNPSAGTPPVVTDWLTVDIDHSLDVAPYIFIPSFS